MRDVLNKFQPMLRTLDSAAKRQTNLRPDIQNNMASPFVDWFGTTLSVIIDAFEDEKVISNSCF
jgi:hypothetical protein